MLAAVSREAYSANPVGRFFKGPCYLCWCAHDGLYGASIWGQPSVADMHAYIELLAVEQRPTAQVHATIIDFRYLEAVAAQSFDLLTQFILRSAVRLGELLTRQWLVRPSGMMGALIAQHYATLSPPYEVRVVTELSEALRGAAAEGEPDAIVNELVQLEELARTGGTLLLALRRHLASARSEADLEGSARALGVSTRTLQRQLRALGTSYVREMRRARLEFAKALLLETDLKLTSVALEAGFPSAQQLCAAFRESEGCSPGSFRRRRARASAVQGAPGGGRAAP